VSDHAGLLRAIADDPDDTARLILADWYEDNGDAERAEFMRTQIQRAARESSHLGGPRELSVSGTSMSNEGIAALRERFGDGLTLLE